MYTIQILKLVILLSILKDILTSYEQCLIDDEKNPNVYRLGQALLPENYKISLIFKEDFNETLKFEVEKCSIKLHLNPNIKNSEVKRIRFHYNSTIPKNKVTLINNIGRNVNFNISDFALCSQVVEITLLDENIELDQEPYTLTFENLIGDIRLDNFGVYLGEYIIADEKKFLVATQFHAPKARFNFPCFDEPAMKATFDISITAPKSYNTIIGNAKIISEDDWLDFNYRNTTFNTTCKISTYMVAYIISSLESASVKGNLNFKVYYVEGKSAAAQYALKLLPKIVEAMESTFGINYTDMGNPLLNQVSLPEISAPAMESLGIALYRESVLLYSNTLGTNMDRRKVLTYMGFAISLNWVGNYVTMEWWSQQWITLGSATYFSYHATAEVETDMELKDQFVVNVVQEALEKDGILYNMPLTSKDEEILHWKEISKKSTLLTEEKGASIIWMIAHIIGTDNLKIAYYKFLQKYKYSTAKASDFIEAFEEEGLPRGTMTEWTEKAHYPTVTVKKVNNSAVLTQTIFSLQRHKSPTQWHIPITYASAVYNENFNNTTPSHWLHPNEELILEGVFTDNIKWIIVNVQVAGFYRVNYEESLWPHILDALNSDNYGGIPAINRAQIIDDVLNMARTMRQSYHLAMDITKYLHNETEYYPWVAAFNAFEYLLIRVGNRKELNALLKRYIKNLVDNLLVPKPYLPRSTDSYIEVLKKVLLLEWSCRCGNQGCINVAIQQFELYKTDPKNFKFNPNLHYAMFCNAMRYGSESDWNFLFGQYELSEIPTEKKRILNALGCSRNPSILMKFLELTIAPNTTIRKQDCYKIFRAVVQTNVDVAYDFFKFYIADISYQFASYNALTITLELLTNRFSTIAQIQDFKKFILDNHNYFHEADGDVIESLVKTAESNIKWLSTFEDEITEWLSDEVNRNAKNVVNLSLVVFSVILFILIY